MITQNHVDKAISYAKYRDLIDSLLANDKTTGENHSENLVHYTRLNLKRMQRIDKQCSLIPEFESDLKQPRDKEIWLVLTEAWCGDAAQSVPAIQHIAQTSADITLKILLRDENLDVMDQYLTNGGRSIPKLICLDAETLEEKWTWGPRPAQAQALMSAMKDDDSITFEDKAAKLHGWYAKDKTFSVQQELWEMMQEEVTR